MQNKRGIALIVGLVIWILVLQALFLVEDINPNIYLTYGETIRYIGVAYLTAMYVISAILIWIEIENLEEFHVDQFTVVSFIAGSFLRQRFDIVGSIYFGALIGITGISITIMLLIRKPKLLRTNFRWVLIAASVSGVIAILITFGELALRKNWALAPLLHNNLTLTVSNLIVRELFGTALLEETLFRGFLWGYLRRLDWDDKNIIWAQGILFWMTHLGRVFTPFTFFVIIPLITLISSKLTLRTKQVFPAIVSHTVVNILSALLNLASY